MRGIKLILLLVLGGWAITYGQTIIQPGETRRVTAQNETLMVMPRSQVARALQHAMELGLADSAIILLEKKCSLLLQMVEQQNAMIQLQQEGYRHYRDLWTETDRKLETAELEAVKWRQRWMVTLLSGLTVSSVAILWAIAK